MVKEDAALLNRHVTHMTPAALFNRRLHITELSELVRAKVIKAIPPAPAGKKYAINAKTLKVELMDATP